MRSAIAFCTVVALAVLLGQVLQRPAPPIEIPPPPVERSPAPDAGPAGEDPPLLPAPPPTSPPPNDPPPPPDPPPAARPTCPPVPLLRAALTPSEQALTQRLAEQAFERSEYTHAIRLALQVLPYRRTMAVHLLLAHSYLKTGRCDRARRFYQLVLQVQDDHAEALSGLSRCLDVVAARGGRS